MAGAKLVIRNGGFDGTEYPLEAEETLIGRNPTTDVTLLDENISREHALILFDAESGVYTIEDIQSPTATKVNGKGIRTNEVEPCDEIHVGHTRFQFFRSCPSNRSSISSPRLGTAGNLRYQSAVPAPHRGATGGWRWGTRVQWRGRIGWAAPWC